MKPKTHKATFTEWRAQVMNKLGLLFEVKNNQIIYKGILDKSLVSFLVDNK